MYTGRLEGICFTAGNWPLDPGMPTLIFIHGSGQNSALWEHQTEALAPVANTIAVDLPGHGRSAPPGRDRVGDYAACLARFVAAVGSPAPVPCGLSIGGAIVLQLLLDHAELLHAAILVGTGARLRVLPDFLRMAAEDFEEFLKVLAAYEVSPQTAPERVAAAIGLAAECPPGVVLGDFKACDRFDVMTRLAEIRLPVLVISAADDRLTPPKYGEYLQKHIAGARRVEIAAAGHLVPVEQPTALNLAVTEFLGKLHP